MIFAILGLCSGGIFYEGVKDKNYVVIALSAINFVATMYLSLQ